MSFSVMNHLPTMEEMKLDLPIPTPIAEQKARIDHEIADVFKGKSDRFIMIIGPCSAHDEESVLVYCNKLAAVQEKVKDSLILIPRIYTNKPRTVGTGYKGMLHQPDPLKQPDIREGIRAIRRLHLRVMSETGLCVADEMLYPENYEYLSDILSYVAVGARSVENQLHRLTVSGLDVPAGMKNPTGGDMGIMLNSIQAGQVSHIFAYNGFQVETSGNDLTHAILRGGQNHSGRNFPNYHYEDLIFLYEQYQQRKLLNPSVIIDTNHANSAKKFEQQPRILREILDNRISSSEIRTLVKGVMIESFIEEGAQNPNGTVFGKSITDPCLGWCESERLIFECADRL